MAETGRRSVRAFARTRLHSHGVPAQYLHLPEQLFPTMVSQDICRGRARSRGLCECSYVSRNVSLSPYTSIITNSRGRSQWPRGLRRGSAVFRLLGLWVRIPPGGHGCLSPVSVVCCQVAPFATGVSLIERSPT
jgi:hypothetical protein